MSDLRQILDLYADTDPVAVRRAAGDRRALLIQALYTRLGTDVAVADALPGQPSPQWVWGKRTKDAPAVHADPGRLAAALALGGPIPA